MYSTLIKDKEIINSEVFNEYRLSLSKTFYDKSAVPRVVKGPGDSTVMQRPFGAAIVSYSCRVPLHAEAEYPQRPPAFNTASTDINPNFPKFHQGKCAKGQRINKSKVIVGRERAPTVLKSAVRLLKCQTHNPSIPPAHTDIRSNKVGPVTQNSAVNSSAQVSRSKGKPHRIISYKIDRNSRANERIDYFPKDNPEIEKHR